MSKMKTVADFLNWEGLLRKDKLAALAAVRPPKIYRGQDIPETLNSLTLEDLAKLWGIKSSRDLFVVSGDVLLGLSERQVMRSSLLPMMGIANMVSSELVRITQKWEEAEGEPTANELMAGAASLNFGVFGIADWYAQRMGMTNHDEAFATPWLRIWQCMFNDEQTRQFQRRHHELSMQQMKR